MANLGLIKSYNAEGAINSYSLVKVGANDFGVLQAAAVSDKIIGVTREVATLSGEPVDVVHDGIANVRLGGTVARGDFLTSDASGNAVTAAPAAGTNNRVVGVARQSGVANDVIEVIIDLVSFQG
jgi:hypothetical protein